MRGPSAPPAMSADPQAVLDACVLVDFGLCDLLLTLAETPRLFRPLWNPEILEEVCRTQKSKLGWPEDLARSWREAVEEAFPEAMQPVPESLLASCSNDEKDRHVLATAIQGQAGLIATHNLRDFPPDTLAPWSVRAVHPADFLIALHASNAEAVVTRLEEIARKRRRTPEQHLALLRRSVPSFAAHVARAAGWDLPKIPKR